MSRCWRAWSVKLAGTPWFMNTAAHVRIFLLMKLPNGLAKCPFIISLIILLVKKMNQLIGNNSYLSIQRKFVPKMTFSKNVRIFFDPKWYLWKLIIPCREECALFVSKIFYYCILSYGSTSGKTVIVFFSELFKWFLGGR